VKVTSDHDLEEVTVTKEVPYLEVRLSVKEASLLESFFHDVGQGADPDLSTVFAANALRSLIITELKIIQSNYGEDAR
jgi:hypothetical protein